MSDEPKRRPRAWIGWVTITLLVLYPLSMGPVGRIAHNFGFDVIAIDKAIYGPILWLRDSSESFSRALIWYLGFWEPSDDDRLEDR